MRAGDGGRDRRACARQHRRRRREVRRMRHARRQGRAAASLRAAFRRTPAARAEDQGGRHRDPPRRRVQDRVRRRRRLGRSGEARSGCARSAMRSMVDDGVRLTGPASGAGACCTSASTSAARSPTWSRWTTTVAPLWRKSASTPEDPSIGVMAGLERLAEILHCRATGCSPRPNASCMARLSPRMPCSNTRAPRLGC